MSTVSEPLLSKIPIYSLFAFLLNLNIGMIFFFFVFSFFILLVLIFFFIKFIDDADLREPDVIILLLQLY